MIITTTGFFNTGSSVITNILQEFKSIENQSGVYEVRLLYDPDSISDLEYHLVENPHRQITSYAIKRFINSINYNTNPLINHHYEKMCDGNFKKISYEYIEELCDLKYKGYSYVDCLDKGIIFNFLNRVYLKIKRILNIKTNFLPETLLSNNIIQYGGTYSSEKFLEVTRKYVQKFLSYYNKNNNEIILIDQFFPPTNIARYVRYVPKEEKVKVFIVDRDPRDLYVTCKYFLKTKGIPVRDPYEFCKWYKWTRGQSRINPDPECVCRIQYEDLIYNYKNTRKQVIEFCGLKESDCIKKGQIFIPQNSLQNTQVWLRYPKSEEEVNYIYKNLSEFCYDFKAYNIIPDIKNGKMFDA